jgi:hypothetical protein
MGRYFLILDPAGYKRLSEPGVSYLIDGPTFLSRLVPDPEQPQLVSHNFFNPPGSTWITTRPRQWSQDWVTDARLSDHVLRADRWTFAAGATAAEWEPTRTASGSTASANQWISVYIPNEAASLDALDYGALSAAAGVTLPTGMITAGFCGTSPGGIDFSTFATQVTPQMAWQQMPKPRDTFVFGWGNAAVIVQGEVYHLLKSPANDKTTWQLIGRGRFGAGERNFWQRVGEIFSSAPLASVGPLRGEARSLLAMCVGWETLYLFHSQGEGVAFKWRETPESLTDPYPDPMLGAGAIWVAAVPGDTLRFQAQLVGYELADSRELYLGAEALPEPWIDLGSTYIPSQEPQLNADLLIQIVDFGAGLERTFVPPAAEQVIAPATGAEISYGLLNETGDPWDVQAGETYRGALFLALTPGNPTGMSGDLLACQVRHLEFRFPEVLAERAYDTLTLDDTEFTEVEAEASLFEPLGGRFRATIWDAGVEKLSASNHDKRGSFPVHLSEDTNGDNQPDTIRLAGWVRSLQVTEHQEADGVTGEPVLYYELDAVGLLEQANTVPMYLPQMVNPESSPPGTIEHTWAVDKALRQSGIDTEDSDLYFAQTDEQAGTELAQLPGTWGRQNGEIGRDPTNEWAPTWKDTWAEYASKLGRDFRGWLLYSRLDGKILYHDHLLAEIERGRHYHADAELYATTAAAVAAGNRRWKYEPQGARDTEEPEGNIVRVAPAEEGNTSLVPIVLERDALSLSDIQYEHYTGSPKVVPREVEINDLGVTRVMCRLILERKCRRRFVWKVQTDCAPWQFSSPVDVGHVITLTGKGDWLIVHAQVKLLKSDTGSGVWKSRLSCMSLPVGAQTGPGGGPYPSRAGD